ncbi:MAG TPA: hypothetical protein VIX73_34630, partial [Kofleriaceae bacterium]
MRWTLARWCAIAGCVGAAVLAAPGAIGTAAAQPAESADPRSDAAWQLYHDAFAALMRGESTRARELASALLRDYPDHAATRLVRGA